MTTLVKAAVMKEPGVIAVQQFPLPEPEPGAVILEMSMSGICGTDKHTFRRLKPGNGVAMRAGDSVVFCFRGQVFYTRAHVAPVSGIATGQPRVEGLFDSAGREV